MSFAHFMATLKLGMEWRLQDQTRGQRQGDFEDSFSIDQDLFFFKGCFSFGLYILPSCQQLLLCMDIILT